MKQFANVGQLNLCSSILIDAKFDVEYTSFDVFPTTTAIPAGTKDSMQELGQIFNWSADDINSMSACVFNSDNQYTNEVEPENRLVLYFESYAENQIDNDIEIDFGDGTDVLKVRDELARSVPANTSANLLVDGIKGKRINGSALQFQIQHTYAKSRKFNVKIYGSNYYTLRARNYMELASCNKSNLVCRLLENELQVHSCVLNMSSFASGCDDDHMNTRLLKVNQLYYYNMKNVCNIAGIFGRCSNLVEAWLHDYTFDGRLVSFQGMFYKCSSLKRTNVYLAPCTEAAQNGYHQVFEGCACLEGHISSFLKPKYSYSNSRFSRTFMGCLSISGNVPAERLWLANDQTVDGLSTFRGCTSLDLASIPQSFGGNAANIQKVCVQTLSNEILESMSNMSTDISANVQQMLYDQLGTFSDFKEVEIRLDADEQILYGLSNEPPTIDVSSKHYVKYNDGTIVERETDSTWTYITQKIYNFGQGTCLRYENVVGVQNNAFAIAAFDKNDNIILSKSIASKDGASGGSTFYIDGTLEFKNEDNDIAYVILGVSYADAYKTKFYLGKSVEKFELLSSAISALTPGETDWKDISANVSAMIDQKILDWNVSNAISLIVDPAEATVNGLDNIPPTLDVQSGYYVGKNGQFVARATSQITQRIYNFGNYKRIRYTNLQAIQNMACALAAFDNLGNIIQSKSLYFKEGAGSGSLVYFDGVFEFDDDVAYVILGVASQGNYMTKLSLEQKTETIPVLSASINSINATLDEQLNTLSKKHLNDLSVKTGYFINRRGGENANAGYAYSEKIYNYGLPIVYENLKGANNAAYYVIAYGSDDKILTAYSEPNPIYDPSKGSGAVITGSGTYEFNESVAYVRCQLPNPATDATKISYYSNDTLKDAVLRQDVDTTNAISAVNARLDGIQADGQQWYGKKWIAYGTSITNGASTHGFYVNWLSSKTGLVLTNRGRSGGSIALSSDESTRGNGEILRAISADAEAGNLSSADLITIEGFVNDWNYGRPLGVFNDGQLSTLHGALEQAIKLCLSCSNATIVLLTDHGGKYNYKTTDVKNGIRQRRFNEEVVSIAKDMNVHCIDVASKAQINEWSKADYIADSSVHLTDLGAAQYGATVWEELKNIHCPIGIA